MRKNRNIQKKLGYRYEVVNIQICPFEGLEGTDSKLFHPVRNDGYDYVLCLRDIFTDEIIDIKRELIYRFIDVREAFGLGCNRLNIIEGYRYGICPIDVDYNSLSYEDIRKIYSIIKKLESSKGFIDGNAINNKEYKAILEEEKGKIKIK